MAKKAGIYGFCFYHYYFNGKTLLEKPIENYRDNSKEKFPYCLIWANQSFTRTWYRSECTNEMLLQQKYGEKEDWEKHFYYILDFFRDKRYIKINNKPVYIIYLPQDIKYRRQMFLVWQQLAKKNGFDGIYLIAMNTWCGGDTRKNLYDAYFDFEPLYSLFVDNGIRKKIYEWKKRHVENVDADHCTVLNGIWMNNSYTYAGFCRSIEKRHRPDNTYAGVFAGWDNTSRKDEDGWIVRDGSPKRFEKCMIKVLREAEKRNQEFVFLNAWNEWSEGAYIEPDKRYGYAYLKAIKTAVKNA
jgi:hypothetical protein